MSHAEDAPHGESDEPPTDSSRESHDPRKTDAPRDGGTWRQALQDIAPYLDLGWRLAGAGAFPPLIGAFVDVQLQTTPWGVLTGAAVGLVGAGLQLRRLQREFQT